MFGGIPDFPAKFTCKRRFDNNASVAHYMKNVAPQQKSAKLPAKKEKKLINFSFWLVGRSQCTNRRCAAI